MPRTPAEQGDSPSMGPWVGPSTEVVAAPDFLDVVEMFGPTIQGEGATLGRAAHFLRLAGCNLTCVWCDTAFSWDPTRADPDRLPTRHRVEDVLRRLDTRIGHGDAATPSVLRLVITGGEPLLQARALTPLCRRLKHLGWTLEVETSGTVFPGQLDAIVDYFNVSPKLAHSDVSLRARVRTQVLEEFVALPNTTFKFVAREPSDLDEIEEFLTHLALPIAPDRIMVMAEGTTGAMVLDRSRDLVEATAARGWGLTPRWHTLLWEDERGR